MSIYNAAISEGVGALQIAITGSSAETDAYYNAAYKVKADRRAAASRRDALQGSLSLIHQEKILSNQNIRLDQAQAEAAARVNAAAAGTSGRSLTDVIYETKKNAVFAASTIGKKYDRTFENVLAQINNETNSLLSIQDVKKPSMAGALLGVAGQISDKDIIGIMDAQKQRDIDKKLEEDKQSTQQPTWGVYS